MNFLAPLFLIGAAGIAIPIILHLVRRQAKGQQEFSSLIFLDPSPPTLLQRSRIDQWLLMLLRALAILLLAAAFARPYWNTRPATEIPHQELHRAILVDTSASMQREGIWPATLEAIQAAVREVQPRDTLSLYTFDDHVQTILAPEVVDSSSAASRTQQVLAATKSLQPTSRGTNLGLALATVADRLMHTEEKDENERGARSEIILISDLQSGSLTDRLENFQWPAECKLTIRRIDPMHPENVSASILASKEDALTVTPGNVSRAISASGKEKPNQDGIPIRVSSHGGRDVSKVSLSWFDQADELIEDSQVEAEVPANGNVVVRIPKLAVETGRLKLKGDRSNFDNDRYVATPPKQTFTLVCIDEVNREATESLGYFLKQLPLDDESRDVPFLWRKPSSNEPWPMKAVTPLIVASSDLSDTDAVSLKRYIEQGGHGVWVIDRSLDDSIPLASFQRRWLALVGDLPSEVHEAKPGRDAMFESIDFTHAIFRGLADSRFNDFTKIRFWRHRCIAISDDESWTTIASYDDQFPVIAYRTIGAGTLWLVTSGWQPSESQLALSSKFVPIISGIFNLAAPAERTLDEVVVGDKLECLAGESWIDPAGKVLNLEQDESGRRSLVVDQLGFYRIDTTGTSRFVAVNLPIAESNTQAMEIERLERLGVLTSDASPTAIQLERKEQLRGIELEGQQRLWRWLMIGMLAALVLETLWSLRR